MLGFSANREPQTYTVCVPTGSPHRAKVLFAIFALALMVVIVLRLMINGGANGDWFNWPSGNFFIAIANIFAGDWIDGGGQGILGIRLTRVVVAVVAGVALATSGVALQNLLRNPLAEPFILGLSSGAAVGFVVQQMLHKSTGHAFAPLHVGALLGAIATLSVVFITSRRRGVIDPIGVLLTGVVINAVNGAIILILYHFNTIGDMAALAMWMQGYLNESPRSLEIIIVSTVTIAGFTLLLVKGRAMDAAMLSDGEAISVGVDLRRLRLTLFAVASLLAAGAVVLAGPLAFVGLICPHLSRLLFGPRHRTLLISSALLGAILLVAADVAVVAIKERTFPIGVFTALIGGPMFLSMLRPRLGRSWE